MIKLVAFDLDGTIGDTLPMCIQAFKEATQPYAGRELSDEEVVQTFGPVSYTHLTLPTNREV